MFKIFTNPFFYTLTLNYCLFIYLFLKMQFLKNKLWLMSYFVFFTFIKCVIHAFFWKTLRIKKINGLLNKKKCFKNSKRLKWKKKRFKKCVLKFSKVIEKNIFYKKLLVINSKYSAANIFLFFIKRRKLLSLTKKYKNKFFKKNNNFFIRPSKVSSFFKKNILRVFTRTRFFQKRKSVKNLPFRFSARYLLRNFFFSPQLLISNRLRNYFFYKNIKKFKKLFFLIKKNNFRSSLKIVYTKMLFFFKKNISLFFYFFQRSLNLPFSGVFKASRNFFLPNRRKFFLKSNKKKWLFVLPKKKNKIYKRLSFSFYKNYLYFFLNKECFRSRFHIKTFALKKNRFLKKNINKILKKYAKFYAFVFGKYRTTLLKKTVNFCFFRSILPTLPSYSIGRSRFSMKQKFLSVSASIFSKYKSSRINVKLKPTLLVKHKLFVLGLEKLFKSLTSDKLKFNLNLYNICFFVTKSVNRQKFEKRLAKNVKMAISKKMLHILKKGKFLLKFAVKLLGWTFKLIGLGKLFSNYLALRIKFIKSHWVLLKVVGLIACRYQHIYKFAIQGIKISLKGKINNSLRTRKYSLASGLINQQSFNSVIDFSQAESFSLSGLFTIKFWIQLK